MAVSDYDKKNLSKADQDRIADVTSKAERGEMSWADAHKTAESIRGNAGYSGGRYGNEYNSNSGGSSSSSGSSTGRFNGVDYTRSDNGGGVYGTPTSNSEVKNVTQNGVTYRVGADMSRRTDLAGRFAISNGYTVFYDENGYATKAYKGVADYTPHQDINAGNGSYGASGAWTDNEMMSAADRQKIADIRAKMNAGLITGDQANQAANAIRAGYGYTIDKNGYVTDSGALSRVNDLRARLGLSTNPESSETQYYRYLMGTDTSPNAQAAGQVQSFGDWTAENGGYTPGASGGYSTDVGGGTTGVSGSTLNVTGRSYNVDDRSDYLKQMYADRIAAELAGLKSAYEQNVNSLDAARSQIPQTYDIARNSAADQNARSRGAFNEMAVAQGLNTGTTGQAALAQDVVYQQNLSDIDRQQAQALSDLDLQRANLDTTYKNAIAQAEATGNAELADALYQEYVRQDELAAQQQASLTAKAQSAVASTKPTLTASQAQTAIKNGIITDDVISAFDYYYGQGAYESLYGSGKLTTGTTGTTGTKTGSKSGNNLSSYNNGKLTTAQVKEMQKAYGVTADGKWGKNSKAAAGGLTADEAWAAYSGGNQAQARTNSAGVTAKAPLSYQTIQKNSSAGLYGPKYAMELNKLQAMFSRGSNASQLADEISRSLKAGEVNEAGAETFLSLFGY